MVMHSSFPGLIASADPLPSCPECGYYLTANPEGLYCTRCDEPRRSPEQSRALTEYIAAREEWEGLRDDIYFANSFAEKDEASAKLGPATARYGAARKEAERVGVLDIGKRLFR